MLIRQQSILKPGQRAPKIQWMKRETGNMLRTSQPSETLVEPLASGRQNIQCGGGNSVPTHVQTALVEPLASGRQRSLFKTIRHAAVRRGAAYNELSVLPAGGAERLRVP
jgi:hypothetical protein